MKELNFEVFLKENGVDTKLFYKNCKKKHQGWTHVINPVKRADLKYLMTINWIASAFNHDKSLQKDVNFWSDLDERWADKVYEAIALDLPIVFGFNKKKKNKD